MSKLLFLFLIAATAVSNVFAYEVTCQPIALHRAIEVANFNLDQNFFKDGYIDVQNTDGRYETFRIILDDGTDYPDAKDAYTIVLDSKDRCSFVQGIYNYTNQPLKKPNSSKNSI